MPPLLLCSFLAAILVLNTGITMDLIKLAAFDNAGQIDTQFTDGNVVLPYSDLLNGSDFVFTTSYGKGVGKMEEFCSKTECTVPVVFGGPQTFEIRRNGRRLAQKFISSSIFRIKCPNLPFHLRHCDFRDICFDGKNFTMMLPYQVTLESPFLTPGGRTPNADKKRDRIYGVIVTVSKATLPVNVTVSSNPTLFTSTYSNNHMLWHSLFDLVLPTFDTLVDMNLEKSRPDIVLSIHSENDYPRFIVESFASSWQKIKANTCFRTLHMGIKKNKELPPSNLYSFTHNFTHKLQDLVISHHNMTIEIPKKPNILFLSRRTGSRSIINTEELLTSIRTTFPDFNVTEEAFERESHESQFRKSHSSTIFIGMHGSGLSNLAWMRPGTALIEIFPYKYTCRDWYERASVVSGLRYYRYDPSSPAESPDSNSKAKGCWSKPHLCSTSCMEDLKEQNVKVDTTKFTNLLKKVVEDLSNNSVI